MTHSRTAVSVIAIATVFAGTTPDCCKTSAESVIEERPHYQSYVQFPAQQSSPSALL